MKFVITESQYKFINEMVERTWRDKEYEHEYPKLSVKLIPIVSDMVQSYDDSDNRITLFDSNKKIILFFYIKSGELFYNHELDKLYNQLLPHPLWMIHGKYIMSEVFEQFFPNYTVLSAKSAWIS